MTRRAVVIGLLLVALSAPVIFCGEIVWGKGQLLWSGGVPAPWPLTLLFLLTALTRAPVLRCLRLTRSELLTIYSIVLVATPLFGMHVIFYIFSTVPSYYYMGRAHPNWESVFLKLIPMWWGPSSLGAVESYFLGDARVPWAEWALPAAVWASVMAALYLASVCLLVLVQRQWIRHERLTFPLAQIPLETVGELATGDHRARLPVSKAFWAGVAIAAAIGFLSQISQRVPAVPAVPMQIAVMSRQPVGPVAALGEVELWLYPWLISLAYLLPKDLSFSVWFLWLVRIGLCALAIAWGVEPASAEEWWRYVDFPAPYNQATGAVVALAVWSLWTARRHLSRVFRIAFSRRPSGADRDEPMPYRRALVGFVVSISWLVAFMILSGCRPIFGVAYILLLVGVHLAYARLQAEGALDPFFWWFNDIVAMPLGMRNVLPAETIVLYSMNWAGTPMPSRNFSACSINTLTSFKIADASGASLRRLTWVLLPAFALALLLGIYVNLSGLYRFGFLETATGKGASFAAWALRDAGYSIEWDITGGENRYPMGMVYVGAGAVMCVFLGLMRQHFLWWPFHPIGYLLSNSIPQAMGTFPFLIAWALKSLTVRYGGLGLYRKTIPLAIGLIVGDLLNSSLWSLVALATRGRF